VRGNSRGEIALARHGDIVDVVSRTPAVIERVGDAIPKGFPAASAETILAGVRASSERLRAELTERVKT
jgi:hypothetical protein